MNQKWCAGQGGHDRKPSLVSVCLAQEKLLECFAMEVCASLRQTKKTILKWQTLQCRVFLKEHCYIASKSTLGLCLIPHYLCSSSPHSRRSLSHLTSRTALHDAKCSPAFLALAYSFLTFTTVAHSFSLSYYSLLTRWSFLHGIKWPVHKFSNVVD